MALKSNFFSQIASWGVHLITASSGVVALAGTVGAANQNTQLVLYCLILTVIIDAIDGPLARLVDVKKHTPNFDGAMLDNVIDFITWVFLPAYFIVASGIFPFYTGFVLASMIVLSSSYFYGCSDVKARNNYFKRFPAVWNPIVICIVTWPLPTVFLGAVIVICSVLSFVPLYFVHSLRLDVVFTGRKKIDRALSFLMLSSCILFLACLYGSVYFYPKTPLVLFLFELVFLFFYMGLTLVQNFIFYKNIRRSH